MEDNGFVKVCRLSDIKEMVGKKFWVDDLDVAVFKVDGKVYALSNVCPHQHASVIYNGFIEDGHIACPNHGWEFDLKTGEMKTPGKGLDKYEAKVENDNVFVKVTQKKGWDW